MVRAGFYETTPEIRKNVREVLDSGRISQGPFCEEVERHFAFLHECDHAVASASGTDSLRAALHAMVIRHGWGAGDEVIVPATTFVATLNIVLQLNMVPVLVDVDPYTFCIDVDKIEAAITEKTRCIIPVNLLGQPANLSGVADIANNHGLKVIEDSCEAMFVYHDNLPVGSWGDIACFSFYMAHLITAGVGGIATTNSAEYADLMRSLLNHGRDTVYTTMDDDDDLSESKLAEVVLRRFHFLHLGYSSRMTELQAAIALPQIYESDEMLKKRRQVAQWLTERLKRFSYHVQLPSIGPNNEHSWMMYGIVTKHEPKRGLVFHLEKDGIETRDLLPILNQPVYSGMFNREDYPVSSNLIEHGFYIGCHQGMAEEDCDYVEKSFETYFKH